MPLSRSLTSGRVGKQTHRGQAGNQTAASRRENGSDKNLAASPVVLSGRLHGPKDRAFAGIYYSWYPRERRKSVPQGDHLRMVRNRPLHHAWVQNQSMVVRRSAVAARTQGAGARHYRQKWPEAGIPQLGGVCLASAPHESGNRIWSLP